MYGYSFFELSNCIDLYTHFPSVAGYQSRWRPPSGRGAKLAGIVGETPRK